MSKLKKIIGISSQVAIMASLCFIFTEIAFRIYHQVNPSFVFYDLSYNRFRGKPFAPDYDFKLNSKGFKDVEFQREKDPKVLRILGLGDSFAYGVVPYQYNYYTRLEEKLNRTEIKAEVINMGIPNIGPKDYLSLLVDEGLELKPDWVIISLFIGNDLNENETRKQYSYSYVASFVRFIIALNKIYEGQVIHGELSYQDDQDSMEYETFLNLQTNRSQIFRDTENFREKFDYSVAFLKQIKQICDRQGIELLVILIPDELQVNQQVRTDVIAELKASQNDFDFQLPNRLLAEEFDRQQINYIDLLDDFRSASVAERLYKPQDTHWNIAGNELAAEIIYQYIRHQMIL